MPEVRAVPTPRRLRLAWERGARADGIGTTPQEGGRSAPPRLSRRKYAEYAVSTHSVPPVGPSTGVARPAQGPSYGRLCRPRLLGSHTGTRRTGSASDYMSVDDGALLRCSDDGPSRRGWKFMENRLLPPSRQRTVASQPTDFLYAEEGNRTPKGVSPGDFESCGDADSNQGVPVTSESSSMLPARSWLLSAGVGSCSRTEHGQSQSRASVARCC